MEPIEQKIESFKIKGFAAIKECDGKVCRIFQYDIKENQIDFILKSDTGGSMSFSCSYEKLDSFLSNFNAANPYNNIQSLRTVMFDIIKGLREGTIEIKVAKAVSQASQVIINSVKLEIDYKRLDTSKETKVPMLDE